MTDQKIFKLLASGQRVLLQASFEEGHALLDRLEAAHSVTIGRIQLIGQGVLAFVKREGEIHPIDDMFMRSNQSDDQDK